MKGILWWLHGLYLISEYNYAHLRSLIGLADDIQLGFYKLEPQSTIFFT